jgi:hypothetical protein
MCALQTRKRHNPVQDETINAFVPDRRWDYPAGLGGKSGLLPTTLTRLVDEHRIG